MLRFLLTLPLVLGSRVAALLLLPLELEVALGLELDWAWPLARAVSTESPRCPLTVLKNPKLDFALPPPPPTNSSSTSSLTPLIPNALLDRGGG